MNMYTLIMMILVFEGNYTYGGPVVVDNFKTKESCEEFVKEYRSKLPARFPRPKLHIDTVNSVDHFVCVKKQP